MFAHICTLFSHIFTMLSHIVTLFSHILTLVSHIFTMFSPIFILFSHIFTMLSHIFTLFFSDIHNIFSYIHYVLSYDDPVFSYIHETRQPHITNCDVRSAIKGLKSEKSDGSIDLRSDSLINGTDLLFKCISNVFTIMLQYGYAPKHFMMSTSFPIPKCMKSNLKCSENY